MTCCLIAQETPLDSIIFFSPSNKFKVVFVKDTNIVYKNGKRLDEVSHVKYRLLFINPGKNDTVAHVYNDVYGFDSPPQPRSPASIFSRISWSPNQDFAILPQEGWARAPGAPVKPAINLNKKYNWTEGTIRINHTFWFDKLRLVGDCWDDCSISVQMFDGSIGKMVTIKGSESPLGYLIDSKTNDTLFVKTILDNCSYEEQRNNFKQKVIAIPIADIKKLIGKPQQ